MYVCVYVDGWNVCMYVCRWIDISHTSLTLASFPPPTHTWAHTSTYIPYIRMYVRTCIHMHMHVIRTHTFSLSLSHALDCGDPVMLPTCIRNTLSSLPMARHFPMLAQSPHLIGSLTLQWEAFVSHLPNVCTQKYAHMLIFACIVPSNKRDVQRRWT